MNLDNLTQLQKIAIEGEVAQALYTAIHDEDVLYRLYVILKKTPKELGYYVLEVMRNLTSIKEEKLYKVIAEVSSDEFPLWIWVNKVIADIKFSLKMSMAEKNITEARINKKEIQQKIIKSAFVYYCRSTAILSPKASIELCRAIMEDESTKVDFLKDTCFSLIEEIKELPPKKKIPEKVLHTSINVQQILSYQLETQILTNEKPSKYVSKGTAKKRTDEDNEIKAPLKEILEEMGVLKEEPVNEVEESTNYAVVKYYKELGISTTLKSFKTEEEAIKYIENINKNFPDLSKTCDLFITQNKGKK